METRWWYDVERPKFSASREDRDEHRRRHLSPLTPSPHDRPRSFSKPTSLEIPYVKGKRLNMEFLSSATAEKHSPLRRPAAGSTGNRRICTSSGSRAAGAEWFSELSWHVLWNNTLATRHLSSFAFSCTTHHSSRVRILLLRFHVLKYSVVVEITEPGWKQSNSWCAEKHSAVATHLSRIFIHNTETDGTLVHEIISTGTDF